METLEELERNAKYRASALEPVVAELIALNKQMAAHNIQAESIISLLIQLRERLNHEQRTSQ